MGGENADDTVLVVVKGERVRLDADRPASYLKFIADIPADHYVAYHDNDRLLGLVDTATVATYLKDGTRIAFRPRDRLAGVIGDQPAEAGSSGTTIYVNGQPTVIRPTTTVAELRSAAGMPEHAVALVRDHDAGQLFTLVDDKVVLDVIQPGGAIAFHTEPRQ